MRWRLGKGDQIIRDYKMNWGVKRVKNVLVTPYDELLGAQWAYFSIEIYHCQH